MSVPGAVADPASVSADDLGYRGAGGDLVAAHLARPAGGSGPWPAVIVVHEAYGLNDHIRDVARRFAGIGYVALAPDLYTREGTPPSDDLEAVFATVLGQPDAQVTADLQGAADHLLSREDVAARVGCIGFCSGGRHTLRYACNTTSLAAAVDCWGGSTRRATPDAVTTPARPVPVIDQVDALGCPTLIVVGAEDANPSPQDGEAIVGRARAAGRDATLSVYEGAGHAFFADYRPTYREAAAFRLWDELQAFFARHLRT